MPVSARYIVTLALSAGLMSAVLAACGGDPNAVQEKRSGPSNDLNTRDMQEAFGRMCLMLMHAHPAVIDGEEGADTIECMISAVQPGWVATNSSDLIGIAGPSRVLSAAGLIFVLPSQLRLEDFGFTLVGT